MDNNITWITKNGVHIPLTNNYMNNKIRKKTEKEKDNFNKEELINKINELTEKKYDKWGFIDVSWCGIYLPGKREKYGTIEMYHDPVEYLNGLLLRREISLEECDFLTREVKKEQRNDPYWVRMQQKNKEN